jgi:opacity protein-like surface antigen
MNLRKKAWLVGAALIAIGGLAGSAQAADPDTPVVDAAPTPEQYEALGWYLRADAGWSFLQWYGGRDDDALTAGVGVGYQFTPNIRGDIRGDWAGDYNIGGGADMSMTTVLGNLYYDFPNDSFLTPYVGAGIGYGWAPIDGGEDKEGLAYSLMAGSSIDLSESMSLDVGYRFREIIDSGADPMDHSILGGFRFKF